MAKMDMLGRFILSFEGGFSNHPADPGGATNKGVTVSTWRSQGYDKNGDGVIDVEDLRMITDEDALRILKKNYWDRWRADEIEDQSLANLLVDWVWSSGSYGIRIPQRILGVTIDGIVGPKTIAALNESYHIGMFCMLHNERREYLHRVVHLSPMKRVFLDGWLRRLNCIRYGELELNTNPPRVVKF